ncbi:hypothetical protein CHELA1G11_70044 [Hyphomicrobiales bacterium]|jgi:hypothetical protein|nr:hypothetical protein CHELA1G2_60030 [Hyphomicrobiales bacterium]CAH1696938.1 hypothetical protein CHELA1G11_70044 [Hyphomicrobiales bacterium]
MSISRDYSLNAISGPEGIAASVPALDLLTRQPYEPLTGFLWHPEVFQAVVAAVVMAKQENAARTAQKVQWGAAA